jgi:hypothetical protein
MTVADMVFLNKDSNNAINRAINESLNRTKPAELSKNRKSKPRRKKHKRGRR